MRSNGIIDEKLTDHLRTSYLSILGIDIGCEIGPCVALNIFVPATIIDNKVFIPYSKWAPS